MKLQDAIDDTISQLIKSKQYRDVKKTFSANKITLTKTDNGISEGENFFSKVSNLNTEVERIQNRFAIEGIINAIKVRFEVKLPRKRKYTWHYEYYKVI